MNRKGFRRKPRETSEIQTKHLLDMTPESYQYANLFGLSYSPDPILRPESWRMVQHKYNKNHGLKPMTVNLEWYINSNVAALFEELTKEDVSYT
jgi:hypothetical protein